MDNVFIIHLANIFDSVLSYLWNGTDITYSGFCFVFQNVAFHKPIFITIIRVNIDSWTLPQILVVCMEPALLTSTPSEF